MELRADYVVIGSGIAGLRAVLPLADAGDVVLLTKADEGESNTGYAQGGIAAAIGSDDSPARHLDDTLRAGAGLCDETAVETLVGEGPHYVRELVDWGARFDTDAGGRPALGREGAHSVRRVLHARDATGREIARTLWSRVSGLPSLLVLPHVLATDLLIEGGGCRGVRFLNPDGRPGAVRARAVLLATGGAGQVYRETTNPTIATGDGLAMAWRAGARLSDLEFVQFHPTVLAVPGAPRFLVSEAVRGEGARLVNAGGEPFMARHHPLGDLAPRDVVATEMVRESARTDRPVYLSLAHLDAREIHRRFPTIADVCARAGLDLARDRLPVSPAAHYVCGGVDTDLDGRTSIPGLFAAGEVACTRVHGANRLASNSLLEGLVFGARAAVAMVRDPGGEPRLPDAADGAGFAPPSAAGLPPAAPEDVPDLMWRSAGLLRDAEGLAGAVARLRRTVEDLECQVAEGPADHLLHRQLALATAGALIAEAAWRRTESRGGHRRTDFPALDDLHWRIHVAVARPGTGPSSPGATGAVRTSR